VSSALETLVAGAWDASGFAGCCREYSGADNVVQAASSRVAASTPGALREMVFIEILDLFAVRRAAPDKGVLTPGHEVAREGRKGTVGASRARKEPLRQICRPVSGSTRAQRSAERGGR